MSRPASSSRLRRQRARFQWLLRVSLALAGALLLFLQGGALAEAAEQVVSISGYRFSPETVRIRPGDTVRWVNQEKRTSHSVVIDGQESERFFPGESWEKRFEVVGEFRYHCGPHPEMKGVALVAD